MPRTVFFSIPLISLMLGAALSSAQAQQAKGYPLESLKVEGNHEIAAAKIIAASGLKTGQTVQKADFDAARARLLATGAFASVGYEYKPGAGNSGYDAVLQVAEVTPVFPYRFEDLPGSSDVLRAAVKRQEPLFGARIPAAQAVLDRCVKAVEMALGSGTGVIAKLEEDSPDEVTVVFRPAAPPPNIAQVHFTGNSVVPLAELMGRMSPVAIGIPYTERNVRKRLDAAIRPLYEARGLIRVSFPKIEAHKAESVDGVDVTITVNEGPAYNLGAVRFTGVPSAEASRLGKLMDLKKGPVNFDNVNAGLKKVSERLHSTGYLHATSKVNRDIHDDNRTINLTVAIETGPRYRFGKLDIEGLDIIGEPAVRKMWGDMEGKPFDPNFPDAFLARVHNEGIFDNLGKTRSEAHIDEASKRVDVTLFFSGAGAQADKSRQPPL